jgi:hypothetical protein
MGFKVSHLQSEPKPSESDTHIHIDHTINAIAFRIQNGPIKEVGENGCQIDCLIMSAREIISQFNATHPHGENTSAIEHLDAALDALERRRFEREARQVEGTSKI